MRLQMPLLLTLLSASPVLAIEIEYSGDTKVLSGQHEDVVVVGSERYIVTDYSQLPEGGIESFDQVPPKYAGAFSRINAGLEISRDVVIKIIDAFYKEHAFN